MVASPVHHKYRQTTLPANESEIIRQCRAGDTSGFDLLVEEHYTRVYNTALRMLGDPDGAADATQAAFVRAFRSLSSFRGDSSFSTWLYRITANVCLDELRNRPQEPVSLIFVSDEDEEPQERSIPDNRTEPGSRVARNERQRVVHQAIGELAAEHRVVLVLYDIEGFSYKDTAHILGIPVGTVKSRLNRARCALKEVLRPHLELFEP